MFDEISIGALIYRIENKEIKYLLLYKKPNLKYKESWDFSRGNIEKKETEIETSNREIYEETSIKDLIYENNFREEFDFHYINKNKKIHKKIVYYLAKTKRKNIKLSFEHNSYKWFNYKDALKILTYNSAKNILKKANKFLIKKINFNKKFN